MFLTLRQTWTLTFLVLSACASNPPNFPCMTVSDPSALIAAAAALNVDVYDQPASCASLSLSAAPRPSSSRLFIPNEPITLQVGPGIHAVVLTTFADAAHTVATGRGCRDLDLAAGAHVCVDLTLTALPFTTAGSDGGNLDGAGVDNGLAPTFCATVQAPFCEDFESGVIAAARWTTSATNATLTVDGSAPTPPPHGGQASLHIHAAAVPAMSNVLGAIAETSALPAGQTFYLRFSYYASAWPPVAPGHDTLIRLGNPAGAIQSETHGGSLTLNDYGAGSFYKASATQAPTGKWFCLEWQLTPNGQYWDSKIWIDSTPVSDLDASGLSIGAPNQLRFGIDISGTAAQGALDIWLDEIIVAAQRIGC